MRDPDGSIEFGEFKVSRKLKVSLPTEHFLTSPLAQKWVRAGRLVPFQQIDPTLLEAQRLPFVTYPFEWCDSQLFDAGELTLALQAEAVEAGFDLKDASAWNIIFDGQRPVFCDLLSFERLAHQTWWAASQLTRHFVLPLLLARKQGLHGFQSFQMWRDGAPPALCAAMLGRRRYFGRYWPLMANGGSAMPASLREKKTPDLVSVQRFRSSLQATLGWMLSGVQPRPPRPNHAAGTWLGYADDRQHYPADSLDRKRATVEQWLTALQPSWVLDLGCNEGEFSQLALKSGAQVIAVDGDHDCIERLHQRHTGESGLYTVVATIDDLCGGRGWAGAEFVGLGERLHQRADLVMMLALVHHLAIGASVPIAAVAALAAHCTRRHVVVEWIAQDDPQMLALCEQRRREPSEFSISAQKQAFIDAGFSCVATVDLLPARRHLALLQCD